jgi:hypothetical protein
MHGARALRRRYPAAAPATGINLNKMLVFVPHVTKNPRNG